MYDAGPAIASSFCGVWIMVVMLQAVVSLSVITFAIAGLVAWVWMLIDVIQREESTFRSSDEKLIWLIIILLTGWVGAVVYYFAEYRSRKEKERRSKVSGGDKKATGV